MSRLSRFTLLLVTALCASSTALAEAPRLVVFRVGGEGLASSFVEDVERAVRARLEEDGRVQVVSREETRDGIATGQGVGVACGAADVECYRKLAVLVEASELLLLRLLPRQGGVVVELARADVASGRELRRVSRRLVMEAPVEALLSRAVEDVLATAAPPSRIAVLPFADENTGVLADVEAAVRRELQGRAGIVVLDADELSAALAQHDKCEDMQASCLAALGARVGVDQVLYGRLRGGNGRPTAALHLLDVVTLTQRSAIGDSERFLDDVPSAVAHLLDDEGAPTKVADASVEEGGGTGALIMASAGGALLVAAGASAATGLLLGGGGPAQADGAADGARAAVSLAVPALAVGAGLLAGSAIWLGTTLME